MAGIKPRAAAVVAPKIAPKVAPKIAPKAGPTKLNGHAAPAAATGQPEAYEIKETVVEVQRRYAGGENTSDVLEIRTFATRPASVSVSRKQRLGTVGQGGEVSVMVTVPAYQEELDGASSYASEKADEYMAREQERLVELAGPDAAAANAEALPGETVEEEEQQTGEGEAEEAGEGQADANYIRELPDEEAFLAFCTESGVEIDMADFQNDLDQGKEAVIAYLKENKQIPLEEGDEGYVAPEEVAAEESDLYSEADLKAMDMDNIAAIFSADGGWNINGGKLPPKARGASDADHKKRCIEMILKFQQDATETA